MKWLKWGKEIKHIKNMIYSYTFTNLRSNTFIVIYKVIKCKLRPYFTLKIFIHFTY